MSAIEHPAARSGKITFCSGAVKISADSAIKCTPQIAGELERVAGNVGELDDLVALVVVTEHE
jgi:hypothetical protein